MSEDRERKKNVIYRRVGGRVIPITVGAGGLYGGVKAADAARTHVVYQAKNIVIQRKKFSLLPMSLAPVEGKFKPEFGTSLHAYNSKGIKMGHSFFGVDKADKVGHFDWLGVKKQFRGEGISKKLARQSAVEMKGMGATKISSHVVHPRSAKLFSDKVRSTYWRGAYTSRKTGLTTIERISRGDALKKVGQWKKGAKIGELFSDGFSIKTAKRLMDQVTPSNAYAGPTIYRDTKIPKNLRRLRMPFRTTKNKLTIGLGLAAAAGSAAYLSFRGKK